MNNIINTEIDKIIEKSIKNKIEELLPTIVDNFINKKNSKPKSKMPIGNLLNESQVMDILGRKRTWLHLKRKSGELKAIKQANHWWYKEEDIIEYINKGQ